MKSTSRIKSDEKAKVEKKKPLTVKVEEKAKIEEKKPLTAPVEEKAKVEEKKPLIPAAEEKVKVEEKKPLTAPVEEKAKVEEKKLLTAVIVDDEPANRDFLVRLIQQAKYETRGAGSGAEALEQAAELAIKPSLFFIDFELPDMQGAELLKKVRELYPDAKTIMATMHDDRAIIRNSFEIGCTAFLVKPHGFMELLKRLQSDPESLEHKVFDKYGVRDFRG